MTRDEMLLELKLSRKVFDDKAAEIPVGRLSEPIPGFAHSVAEILYHVSAYERLIVERLVAARHGASTALQRDREGWEAFNAGTWGEASGADPGKVLSRSKEAFDAIVHEIGMLSDDELNAAVGSTASLDQAWLQGREPWRAIAEDSFAHYPQHFAALDAAVSAAAAK